MYVMYLNQFMHVIFLDLFTRLSAHLHFIFSDISSSFFAANNPVCSLSFLISNFRRFLNVVFFLLGDTPASETFLTHS